MDVLLRIRVQLLRYLLDYNDSIERRQEPQAPEPSFTKTISSPSITRHVQLHFYTTPGFDTGECGAQARHPLVVDFHGGGLTAGLPSMDARWAGSLIATEARPVVVGVNYGLAPENPFPAALQDATAALLWLATDGAAEYGLDVQRVILTGFSGGGTLALAVPIWLASRKDNAAVSPTDAEILPSIDSLLSKLPHPLRGTIAIYPGIDFRLQRKPAKSLLGRFMHSTWDDAFFKRSPVYSPFVSPAAAGDSLLKNGLPEHVALYSVSDDDLSGPCEDFRKRLASLGKRASGDVEPDAAHAWDKMPIRKDTAARWQKRHDWFMRMAHVAENMLLA
ncbi:hypothetical protein LTR09_012339 [Extremus antarcticus]|uniref:Alpha/beta hydrolase fold-3 domain-containing protein n=1 Tax=Extremus antarcticus TaxID=702011 RepID=A0AAJ0G4G4_9PEZI|nr:hypothetical protein LTR09_012339 [Extremus antarcticus]